MSTSQSQANDALPVLVALALLVSGLFYFRRMEKTFADVV
jgi:ABC-type polysaccharide/polyol phosphate export permease